MKLIDSLKERFLFFITGIKDHSQVVSFFPSSDSLSEAMLRDIDFDKAKVILEYGPGTGTFTRVMLKRGRPDLKIIGFELNKTFHDYLLKNINDARFECINDSAENSIDYLKKHNITQVDYIISSLPFSHIPENIKVNILRNANKILNGHGSFNHYRYNSRFVEELKNYFSQVEMKPVWMNLPPAYVYTGRN
jgi:phosphatidylethanolamine/phosphatidyl-N-methylethanolamine N-methyltransferase